MTARLASHPAIGSHTRDVVDRLTRAGIDVELAGEGEQGLVADPLKAVRDATIDLALVGVASLGGSAADGLTTVAVLPRAEPRDVLVVFDGEPEPLRSLPPGARIGTGDVRRASFLRAHRPDLEPVQGATPDREGSESESDLVGAIVSARTAHARGWGDRIGELLDPRSWLPEPGQGALALIARHPIAEATAVDHLPTRTALRTELALLDAMGLGDDAPLGCLAQTSGRWIRLWAAVVSVDGRRLVRSELTGPLDEPESLGSAAAKELRERGAEIVLAVAS